MQKKPKSVPPLRICSKSMEPRFRQNFELPPPRFLTMCTYIDYDDDHDNKDDNLIFRRIQNSSSKDDQSRQVVSDEEEERPIAAEGRHGGLHGQGRYGGGRGFGAFLVDFYFGLLQDGGHVKFLITGDSCKMNGYFHILNHRCTIAETSGTPLSIMTVEL
jgi:hypothetical protein